MIRYDVKAEIWAYAGPGGWHFLTLPVDVSEGIRNVAGRRRPWGSLRVTAIIGEACWQTSLFPDSKAGTFLLPVKAEVRRKAGVGAGDRVAVVIEIDV